VNTLSPEIGIRMAARASSILNWGEIIYWCN